MARNVKQGIINPNSTNSLVIFIIGSIVAGFAAGLGWGLATKILEKSAAEAQGAVQAMKARARAVDKAYGRYGYGLR